MQYLLIIVPISQLGISNSLVNNIDCTHAQFLRGNARSRALLLKGRVTNRNAVETVPRDEKTISATNSSVRSGPAAAVCQWVANESTADTSPLR